PAAQLLLLDGLDAAVRRLHVLLPRDRARDLHRALLSVSTRALDLGDGDGSGNLCPRRARPQRREGLRALPRGGVCRGTEGPSADRQQIALAKFSPRTLRDQE